MSRSSIYRLLFVTLFTIIYSITVVEANTNVGDVPRIVINPKGHNGKINALHFSKDGEKIISISEDKSVRIWDAIDGDQLDCFYPERGAGPEGMIYTSSLSPDGKYLAIGGYPVHYAAKNYIAIIDLEKKEQVAIAYGHINVINSLDFSGDGRYLASGDDDGQIRIWSWAQGELTENVILKLESRVLSLDFSSSQLLMAVATESKDAYLYNLANIEKNIKNFRPVELIRHKANIRTVQFSPDGNYIATAAEDQKIVLWNAKGEYLSEMSGFNNTINAMAFSYDSKVLVAMEEFDGKGYSFSIPEGNRLSAFSGHDNTVFSAEFSPASLNGNYQVASSGGANNEIVIWNAINGKALKRIKGRGQAVWQVRFGQQYELFLTNTQYVNPENNRNAVMYDLATLQLKETYGLVQWDLETKFKGIRQVSSYELEVYSRSIQNNPDVDGRILDYTITSEGNIVVGSDFSLKLYDPEGLVIKEFVGHTGAVRSLSISDDGRYLASGSDDQTINIWNLTEDGSVPSMREVYTEDLFMQYFEKMGLDSIAKVPSKEAWYQAIYFLRDIKDKSYKEFEKAVTELAEQVRPHVTLFIADNQEWILHAPSGYFGCSSQGGEYFVWQINMGVEQLADFYNADQYFDILYRPQLMIESIKTGMRVDEILRNKGERVFDLTKLNRPSAGIFGTPLLTSGQIRGLELKRRDYNTESKNIRLVVDSYDGGGGVKEINIYQNGKLVINDNDVKIINEEMVQKSYDVNLVNGKNEFKLVVVNYQNIESRPDNLIINYTGDVIATTDLYVLSIGINKYKNEGYNLNYAQPDALAFTQKIIDRGQRIFKEIKVTEVYDEQADKQKIIDAFTEMASNAKQQDVFVFYYAGHGSIDNEDPEAEYYLVPHDVTKLYGDNAMMAEKGISGTELKDMLASIKCQKQLILLDACHSGGAVKSLMTRAAASEEKAIFQLARSAGVVLLASSGTQQYATEFEVLKHGVFTYALLEGLDGKNGVAAEDRKITVNELKAYMEDRVPELSLKHGGKAQYPTGFSNGQDFPISLLGE